MFYGIPTGWSWQELDRLLTSIKRWDQQYDIHIINNNPCKLETQQVIDRFVDERCTSYAYGKNIGVAASWNKLCDLAWAKGYDRAIILNDDMVFMDDLYLQSFQQADPSTIIICSEAHYACMCLSRQIFEQVGRFDESNYAYYEDNDYHYRRKLLGIEYSYVETHAVHGFDGDGSRTIKNDPEMAYQNSRCFPIAQQYYQAKWGGMPDHETYTIPFNGGQRVPGSIHRWESGSVW